MPQNNASHPSLLPGDPAVGGFAGAANQLAQAFMACRQELLRYVRGHVRCPDTSSDIAQETFVKALATPAGSIREPRAFLFRTARNLSIDYLRHQKIRAETEDDDAGLDNLVSPSPSVEATLHARRGLDALK